MSNKVKEIKDNALIEIKLNKTFYLMFGIKLPSNIVFTSDGAFLLLWCYVNIHSQLAIFPSSKKVHSIRGDVV